MGQLRTALVNLQKSLVNNPVILEDLKKDVNAEDERLEQLVQTAVEGWNSLQMYLVAKFDKEGSTIAENRDKTMKELMDSEISSLGKGIEQWRKTMVGHSEKAVKAFEDGVGTLLSRIDAAADEAKRLRVIAEKKKAKWLVSKEYKSKIKGYLAAIDDVEAIIASQTKTLGKAKGLRQNPDWINRYFTIGPKTTVDEVESNATMSHMMIMENYMKNKEEQDKYVHKWRDDYKAMGVQMTLMKKWVNEADEMEEID